MPDSAHNSPAPPRTLIAPASRITHAMYALGAPKLGMALIILLAIYSAIGAMPVGPLVAQWLDLHSADMLRALPSIDLPEQQWFSTPIFLAIVLLIVLSLLCATLTRLPLAPRAIPGWLLHAGAGILCLGAAIYAPLKQEGVILLPAPVVESRGPRIVHFLADHSPVIALSLDGDPTRTIPLPNLPLHTDHSTPWDDRSLSIPLPELDPGISATITGYARAAEPIDVLLPSEPSEPVRAWSLDIDHPDAPEDPILIAPNTPPISIANITLEATEAEPADQLARIATRLPPDTTAAVSIRSATENMVATSRRPATIDDLQISIITTYSSTESRSLWGSNIGPIALIRIAQSDQPSITALVTYSGLLHSDAPIPDSLRMQLLHASEWRATFSGVTAIVRAPGATVRTMSPIEPGASIRLSDHATIRLSRSFSQMRANGSITRLDPPDPLLGATADRSRSAIRLTITTDDGELSQWIRFARLAEQESVLVLPDGRTLTASFQPRSVSLRGDLAFALISSEPEYLTGGRVLHDLRAEIQITKSGEPTRTATITLIDTLDIPRRDSWWRRLTGDRWRLSIGAWDQEGWERSAALTEMGVLSSARTRFVVLRIGDAPGIRIIAVGGALIALGAVTGLVRALVVGVRG